MCRRKLGDIEFWVTEVQMLWQYMLIFLQVLTRVPQNCFMDDVQLELQSFGSEMKGGL